MLRKYNQLESCLDKVVKKKGHTIRTNGHTAFLFLKTVIFKITFNVFLLDILVYKVTLSIKSNITLH